MFAEYIKRYGIALAISFAGLGGVLVASTAWVEGIWVLAIIAVWIINSRVIVVCLESEISEARSANGDSIIGEGLSELAQEINVSMLDYSRLMHGELDQIQGLVADAVVSLHSSFTGLEAMSHAEQEMVMSLIEHTSATVTNADGENRERPRRAAQGQRIQQLVRTEAARCARCQHDGDDVVCNRHRIMLLVWHRQAKAC